MDTTATVTGVLGDVVTGISTLSVGGWVALLIGITGAVSGVKFMFRTSKKAGRF